MNQVSGCRDITSKSSGKKYGIVPARIYQITIIYCALLRQSRDTVPVAEHPYISYRLVTRTFPEHSWIPIYTTYFCIQRSDRNYGEVLLVRQFQITFMPTRIAELRSDHGLDWVEAVCMRIFLGVPSVPSKSKVIGKKIS